MSQPDESTFIPTVPPAPHGFDPRNMTDEEVLTFVRTQQMHVVDQTWRMYNGLPSEKVHATMMMQALDGLAKNAQTNKRLKAETEGGTALQQAGHLITQLLTKVKGLQIDESQVIENASPPTLGAEVPAPVLVPGETDINAAQLDYDSFFAQVHAKRAAEGG